MTKFEIPQDGYWHCKVCAEREWPIEKKNMNLEQLNYEIVEPYKQNKSFIVDGKSFKNKDSVKYIKIVHTSEKAEYYGTKFYSYIEVEVVFEEGEDWTARLLYSDESVSNNEGTKDKKSLTESSFSININNNNSQTQSQTQHQEQNFTLENIQQLQDAFADFREEYRKLPNVDDSLLKETQDSLDALSKDSSLDEKNKAFNKVRRILKKAEGLFNDIGEKATKVFITYKALKNIYDILSAYLQS